jgi:hypothetical protein
MNSGYQTMYPVNEKEPNMPPAIEPEILSAGKKVKSKRKIKIGKLNGKKA